MNTDNVKCTRCMEDLILEYIDEGVEGEIGPTYNFICPNCGARYECTEPCEEEKKDFDFYKDGEDISGRITEIDIMNGHCTNCGHSVSMSNNFMLSDYDDTITDENDDKMNFILNQCPYCGMQEVRWDNCENEKKHFPYWKEDVESEELLKNDEEEK